MTKSNPFSYVRHQSSVKPGILGWRTKDTVSAVLSGIESGSEVTQEILDRKELLSSLKAQGGLGYLLRLGDHFASTK